VIEPLRSELADDDAFADLVERFRLTLPARVAALEDASRRGDFAALRRLTHTLKGAGGCFGYPLIQRAAAALETAATSHDVAAVVEGVRQLACVCERAWAWRPRKCA
jgi:HPt (histidine-containing phosphotransfer) domain-containing protein